MFLPASLLLLLSHINLTTSKASPPPPQNIFSNPTQPHNHHIPTIHESAILARRILNLSSIATLSTVFPTHNSNNPHLIAQPPPSSDQIHEESQWGTPPGLSGAPIGLIDYYVSCAPEPYAPTILAISIATTFRNTRAGSNVTLSLRWHPPHDAPPSDDVYTYSPANMPRFSLIGYIEPIPETVVEEEGVETCFLAGHPDAEAWTPGNEIHESWWGRLRVERVYWIGGFGDRAYIGWIPKSEWEGVEVEEVRRARLVGEEGYEEYRSGGDGRTGAADG